MAEILLIDDDKSLAATMRLILVKKGFRVREANDSRKALELLGVEPDLPGAALPGIILLDLGLPGMDGFELATRLEENSRTREVPVIFLTGKGQMLELSEMPGNVKAYVQKPFEPASLLGLIHDVLDGKRPR